MIKKVAKRKAKAEIEPFISPGREKHNQSFTEHFAHQKPLPEASGYNL